MMLTGRSPPDLVQHVVHVEVRRPDIPLAPLPAATVTDVDDGRANRICRRPTLRTRSAGPRSTSPAAAPSGQPGGSTHPRTGPDRVERFAEPIRGTLRGRR